MRRPRTSKPALPNTARCSGRRMRGARAQAAAAACAGILVLVLLTSAGCGEDAVTVTSTAPEPAVTISLAGSGTAQPLIELLADAYHEAHPTVDFEFMPQMHSGGGIKGAAEGMFDIGIVSRAPTPEEAALGLRYVVASLDGLTIATHSADLEVDDITTEQVKGIYSGDITNWSEIGGVDAEIVVLDRNEDESAKIVLREFVLGPVDEFAITPRAASLNQESDMIDGLVNTQATIGYLSLGYALLEDLPIHLLRLDGVQPTPANITNGTYKMTRALGIVVKPDAADPVLAFVDYLTSDEAHAVMGAYFAPAPD